MKMKKKKKKIHGDGDPPLGHPECPWPLESSPAKGSKKKPVRVEAPEYIPLGDGPRASVKKKVKSKKRVEQADTVESALKKKKKRQESKVAEPPWEEVGFPSEAGCLGRIRVEAGSVCMCAVRQKRRIY